MAMGRRLLLFAAGLLVGLFLLIGGLFLAAPAMAVEPICPGGSSPRADIVWCADYDNLTNCISGQENQCAIDNGYVDSYTNGVVNPYVFKIIPGSAAVGTGFIRGMPRPGSTGAAQGIKEPMPGGESNAFNLRYYIRYRQYMSNETGIHGPQIEAKNAANTCFSALKFQGSTYGVWSYYPIGCGVGSYQIPPNTFMDPRGRLYDNRWYLIEMHAQMDTACTNTASFHGCNGVYRVWIDDVLVVEYTDLNFGGVTNGMKWGWRAFVPENYYHPGVAPWRYQIDFDNFVYSNTGTKIGPAVGENARGTANTSSPYESTGLMYEAWLGRHPAGDCTSQGYLGPLFSRQFRSGGSLQSAITHGLYVGTTTQEGTQPGGGCGLRVNQLASFYPSPVVNMLVPVTDGTSTSDCTVGGGSAATHTCTWNGTAWVSTTATDNALKVNLTANSDGGGVVWDTSYSAVPPFAQRASYGWIYLPSSNTYAGATIALSGYVDNFVPSFDATQAYVAVSIDSGNWAVRQRSVGGGSANVISTATPVTFDTWHEYELVVWNDSTVSLMVDRVRLLNRAVAPTSLSWVFAAKDRPNMVIGVIDFQGAAPFVVYYDDNTLTSVSAWSCDGWGSASCPFTGLGLPAPPTGLTVR